MMIVFQILLLIGGLFLVASILFQSSKSHRLSGTIAGGAETFFGKDKGGKIDRNLSTWTSIVGGVFVVIALVIYVIQPSYSAVQSYENVPTWHYLSQYYEVVEDVEEDTETEDTTDDVADTTEAAE